MEGIRRWNAAVQTAGIRIETIGRRCYPGSVSGRQITELMVQGGAARYKRQSERGEAVSAVAPKQVLQVSYAGQIILAGEFYEE